MTLLRSCADDLITYLYDWQPVEVPVAHAGAARTASDRFWMYGR